MIENLWSSLRHGLSRSVKKLRVSLLAGMMLALSLGVGTAVISVNAARWPAVLMMWKGAIRHDVPDAKYRELGQQAQFNSVGLVRKADEPIGSCVLISPDWVLTAAHVVKGVPTSALTFELNDTKVAASEVVIHPDYQPPGADPKADPLARKGMDLALVHLSQAITGIVPAACYTRTGELGRIGTSVGFGRSGAGGAIVTNPSPVGTKRGGNNMIDAIGGEVAGRRVPDFLLVADFDHPDNPSLNKIGDAKPLSLEYMIVSGDSGGGLFIQEKNDWFLVGITVTGTIAINDDIQKDGIYGSLSYWMRVTLFNAWINQVMSGKPRERI